MSGTSLGDDRFAPFWSAAEATGALVFIHPTTRGFETGAFADYYLWNTVGNPLETTVTAAQMVMAGVLERHPGLRVVLAHGGGAILALRGRLRHAHSFQPQARARLKESPEDSLRRFHYDTVTHDPRLLADLIAFAGPDRVVLGTDHPFDMGDYGAVAAGARAGPRARGRGGGPVTERGAAARPRPGPKGADRPMSTTADIVVAGGGHNSLITAAYLTKAGYECLVLDARPIPGGGAATEELIGPGYRIDSCSTGHTLIRLNPLLMNDELGLQSDYGLEYFEPDPVAHVAFPDGEQISQWLDLDRTCEEIARFSEHDAEAYRRMVSEYDEVKQIYGRSRVTPPGFGPTLEEMLLEHPRGRIWLRRNAISAWDVIRREFEDRHIQAFMCWQAFQTLVPLDAAGLRHQRLLDHLRAPAPQLVDPPGRLRGAHHRPDQLPRGQRLHGAVRPPRDSPRARGRALHRRGNRGRGALRRRHGGAVDHPRQAPRGHGARRRLGG